MINFYSCSKNWFSLKEFFFHYHVMLWRCLCSFLELLDVLELRRPSESSRRRRESFTIEFIFVYVWARETHEVMRKTCALRHVSLWKCIKADKTSNEPICLPSSLSPRPHHAHQTSSFSSFHEKWLARDWEFNHPHIFNDSRVPLLSRVRFSMRSSCSTLLTSTISCFFRMLERSFVCSTRLSTRENAFELG